MFRSAEIESLFNGYCKTFGHILKTLNALRWSDAHDQLVILRNICEEFGANLNERDNQCLNDLYVFKTWVQLFDAYKLLWETIVHGEFSTSWSHLQDALDDVRLIKKFVTDPTDNRIQFFENQLLELEKLYPYKIFASVAITIEWFECSICGKDIDGHECPHMPGELYEGKMASGIAHNILTMDHTALVENPDNKRCVVEYDNSAPQFKLIRYLSRLITDKRMFVLEFFKSDWTKRKEKNPSYENQSKNELCKCGSVLTFDKCCLNKEFIEKDHVDIVRRKYKNPFGKN
jgi:hypothetical protein